MRFTGLAIAYVVTVILGTLLFVALLSLSGCDGHEATAGIITGGAVIVVMCVVVAIDNATAARERTRARELEKGGPVR